jgi:hypothetical protein
MLPVSLDCLRPVSCVPNVTSVSGLSLSDNLATLVTLGTQDTGRRQSRDTGNIGYTRHMTKTIQRHWQHWVHKTQDEDNPETLSLDCLRPVSCVPNVTSVSGLSSFCVLCTQYKIQDEDNPETLVTLGTQDTG